MERQNWDARTKDQLRKIFGSDFSDFRDIKIDYGEGAPGARIDGTIAGSIAVEIETRTDKQVRGALMDLVCHKLPRKLLILLPVHMNNPQKTMVQCQNILARFLEPSHFRVILFEDISPKTSSKPLATSVGEEPSKVLARSGRLNPPQCPHPQLSEQ